MSIQLTDCKFMVGGFDLSGYSNNLSIEYGPEMLDDTRFGVAGTRNFRPGMKTVGINVGGFIDYTLVGLQSPDSYMYSRIGAVKDVMSCAHDGDNEGDVVYTVQGVNGKYNPLSGEVGALLPFEFTGMASNTPLVRGRAMAYGSKAANGNSTTGYQFSAAVATGQTLYSALHVLGVGTNVIVTIESDDNSGFTTPTTRITHTTMTAIGADWKTVAGPIATDTYYRAKWTVSGGAATIWVIVGIL